MSGHTGILAYLLLQCNLQINIRHPFRRQTQCRDATVFPVDGLREKREACPCLPYSLSEALSCLRWPNIDRQRTILGSRGCIGHLPFWLGLSTSYHMLG